MAPLGLFAFYASRQGASAVAGFVVANAQADARIASVVSATQRPTFSNKLEISTSRHYKACLWPVWAEPKKHRAWYTPKIPTGLSARDRGRCVDMVVDKTHIG